MDSQNAEILAYLKRGEAITQAEAVRVFGIYRLSARIFDLRAAGHMVLDQWQTGLNRHGKPVKVKAYRLG